MNEVFYCYGDSKRSVELKALIKKFCPNVDFRSFDLSAEENVYYIVKDKVYAIDALSDFSYADEFVDFIKQIGTEIKLSAEVKIVEAVKYASLYYQDNIGTWLGEDFYDTKEEAMNPYLGDALEEGWKIIGYVPIKVYIKEKV